MARPADEPLSTPRAGNVPALLLIALCALSLVSRLVLLLGR